MHVPYDVNAPTSFFSQSQTGGNTYNYYRGYRTQRGYGQRGRGIFGMGWKAIKHLLPIIGNFISPYAKEAVKALTQQGVESGAKILTDISQGRKPKEAIEEEGTTAAKNLARRAGERLVQAGSGRKRKRSLSNLHLIGRSVLEKRAKRKRNNLGLY